MGDSRMDTGMIEPIMVVLQGGLVSSVCSKDPELIGRPVVIIDYDRDDYEESELTGVRQGNGQVVTAFVRDDEVEEADITPLED